jgi:hypothetical protein
MIEILQQRLARLADALRTTVTNTMVRLLTKESAGYAQRFPNDLERLRTLLRPGDVVLVEGRQRVSEVIKYLTQSSWSHAGLYVGDRLLTSASSLEAARLRKEYGEFADALIIEANIEHGVTASPLSKYRHHNIRICRAIGLTDEDRQTVLDTVIDGIGTPYNVAHILDLARFFFPVSLIPRRWRRTALQHGGPVSRELICSSQIALAFQKVRYPVLPTIVGEVHDPDPTDNRPGVVRWLPRRLWKRSFPTVFTTSVFAPGNAWLMTPRDFDVSPYFQIIKSSAAAGDFDYRRMIWAEPAPAVEPSREAADSPPIALQEQARATPGALASRLRSVIGA